ncbi:hypothetical protein RDWZM_001278 [Blomia tropicalis]|uniref:Uncharacterized protein n=1 Tax=Blomia tropicalis TaxID=40697 RepID=A0A9Q0MCT5_BLOTA|nr:hypothetical protein RDWZM_001278 [Blomia tropicalis]
MGCTTSTNSSRNGPQAGTSLPNGNVNVPTPANENDQQQLNALKVSSVKSAIDANDSAGPSKLEKSNSLSSSSSSSSSTIVSKNDQPKVDQTNVDSAIDVIEKEIVNENDNVDNEDVAVVSDRLQAVKKGLF